MLFLILSSLETRLTIDVLGWPNIKTALRERLVLAGGRGP